MDPGPPALPPPAQHNTPGPHPPKEALDVAGDWCSWDFPNVDQVLWVGNGAVGMVVLSEGGAAQALFADAP